MTNVAVQAIRCPVGAAAVDAGEIDVTVLYEAADPFAVTLVLWLDNGMGIGWTFARDLLADGMNGATGLGDVAITPDLLDDAVVWVCLHDPEGTGSLQLGFGRADLEWFLDGADAVVPAGTESDHVDWDRALWSLAGGR
ncbi:SsgA family sporulation/cell division regulator [Amycolatopsis sp. NPDC059021]|uniref:SsgA family sporulation/cell division regulator n=1 Tax=Amycolatopsis sp. NPDC059021 TaxID=3346704 RepID=UPI00366D481C